MTGKQLHNNLANEIILSLLNTQAEVQVGKALSAHWLPKTSYTRVVQIKKRRSGKYVEK